MKSTIIWSQPPALIVLLQVKDKRKGCSAAREWQKKGSYIVMIEEVAHWFEKTSVPNRFFN